MHMAHCRLNVSGTGGGGCRELGVGPISSEGSSVGKGPWAGTSGMWWAVNGLVMTMVGQGRRRPPTGQNGIFKLNLNKFRRQCAKNRDIKSLLAIAKYRFIKGSAAVNISNLPEMCYYYGRLHRAEELKEFLQEKSFYLFMLPDSCTSLAENL
jgi:hypothetical protein